MSHSGSSDMRFSLGKENLLPQEEMLEVVSSPAGELNREFAGLEQA